MRTSGARRVEANRHGIKPSPSDAPTAGRAGKVESGAGRRKPCCHCRPSASRFGRHVRGPSGKVGGDLTIEQGYNAAKLTGLAILADLKRELPVTSTG